MNSTPKANSQQHTATELALVPESLGETARWRINGYAATIFIWTREAWERLEHRPIDAQPYPCGVWCALRLDD